MSYRTIVADPPWQYQKSRGAGPTGFARTVAEHHYTTMPVSAIAALPVRELADADAHLFMWVTNPVLTEQRIDTPALEIVRAWGFTPKSVITWVKTTRAGEPRRNGLGYYFRGATEHVIHAVRGRAGIPSDQREPNVILAPAGRHSEKPEAFYELVERVAPGPYLELFARRPRAGWDVWGNEVESTVELAAA